MSDIMLDSHLFSKLIWLQMLITRHWNVPLIIYCDDDFYSITGNGNFPQHCNNFLLSSPQTDTFETYFSRQTALFNLQKFDNNCLFSLWEQRAYPEDRISQKNSFVFCCLKLEVCTNLKYLHPTVIYVDWTSASFRMQVALFHLRHLKV